MPSYAWTCYACQSSNPAGTEKCVACGFSASASSAEIAEARRKLATSQPTEPSNESTNEAPVSLRHEVQPEEKPSEPKQPNGVHALLLFLFGIVCLVGSYQSFSSGHWPVFMPPQLDLFAVPFTWLSEQVGAVVGGALACLVGLASVVASLGIFAAPPARPNPIPLT
jgi:hypothetical protein